MGTGCYGGNRIAIRLAILRTTRQRRGFEQGTTERFFFASAWETAHQEKLTIRPPLSLYRQVAMSAYSSDWKGDAIGASHKYNGIKVEEGGKGLLGNKYGGKDFFDD